MQYQQFHSISTLSPSLNQQQAIQQQQQQQQQFNQQQSQQVPFGTLPLTQPGSLSYGFGLSQASNFNTWNQSIPSTSNPGQASGSSPFGGGAGGGGVNYRNTGFGSSTTTSSPHYNHSRQTITPLGNLNSSNNSRRRRRSISIEDDEREFSSLDSNRYNMVNGSGVGGNRIMKKVKILEDVKLVPGGSNSRDSVKEGIDLGKALASLPKESLLKILTSLVTTSPNLIPTIQSLLPPPTLSQTLLTLATLERAIIQTLPTTTTTTSTNSSSTRIDYIYGRIRIPLEEYITECKSFLNAFCSSSNTTPSSSSGGGGGGGEDEIGHPSTTFSLLYSLASSLRRLELALPPSPSSSSSSSSSILTTGTPLSIHLLPLLINAFHIFLTNLSTSVNQEGKILSGSILRNWFERLDQLCIASPFTTTAISLGLQVGGGGGEGEGRGEGPAKKALEGVRDRMRREIGWVVGLREVVVDVTSGAGGDGMDEEL